MSPASARRPLCSAVRSPSGGMRPAPASTSVPARMRTILYKYPSAQICSTIALPSRRTRKKCTVRTVSVILLPALMKAAKSCVPTAYAAARAMAASSSGCEMRQWYFASKGSSTGLFQMR